MLAGNYSERALVLLGKGDKREALASILHAVGLQGRLLAVDPKGVPARVNMATHQSRLATVYDALGEPKQAAAAWQHAAEFYDQLKSGGYLTAPDVIADSARAHMEAARFGKRDAQP
jgi:tetratricopeptide (TPR) repeat protein